jgi:hypothetical protein
MTPEDFQKELDKNEAEKQAKAKDSQQKQTLDEAKAQVVDAMVQSTKANMKHRENTTTKVDVQNPIAEREDVAQAVSAINNLAVMMFSQNQQKPSVNMIDGTDLGQRFADLGKTLTDLLTEVKNDTKQDDSMQAVIKQLDAQLNQLKNLQVAPDPDVKKSLANVEKALSSLDVKPQVNLPAPKVTVQGKDVDLSPLVGLLNNINETIKKLPTDNDDSAIIAGLDDIQSSINNLTFPVPNYVLPFKDVNGKATQVQLDSSGNVPTSGGGSGGGGAVTNAGVFATQLNASQSNTSGTITSNTSVITDTDLAGVGAVTVQISGAYVGVNVTFEASVDGTNFVPIAAQLIGPMGVVPATTSGVLVTNSTNVYNVSPLLGIAQFRVRATAYISGTANVIISPSAQFVEYYDASTITDGTNPVNILNSNGSTTGKNALFISGTNQELTGLTATGINADLVPSIDVSSYGSIVLHVTSVGGGATISFQQSNDNVNFVAMAGQAALVNNNPITSTTTTGVYVFNRQAKYFRARLTAFTSGNITGVAEFYTVQTIPYTAMPVGQQGAWTVGVTGYPTAAATADTLANPTVTQIGALREGFNGTTWDRVRNNTTGVVIAAGATATNAGVTIPTYNATKLTVLVNIATATAATLTVTVSGVSSSGYTWPILVSTALATTGLTPLRIFPGAGASANATANDMIPSSIKISTTVTGTITYGIDYALGI